MNAKVNFVITFPQVDTTVVGSENTKLQQHCDDVKEKLDNAINKNKKILSDLEEYWGEEGKLKEHLKRTRIKLDENKPVVMDAAKLKEQLGRVQVRCDECCYCLSTFFACVIPCTVIGQLHDDDI